MVRFSSDVDILKYEPVLFGELHLPWQVLIEATGATLSGTTLTASGADFSIAGVAAGHVVYLRSADGALDGAYEIVSVDSATQLTISVVRSDNEASPVAPPAGSDVSYRISTFDPQAVEAAFELAEYFSIRPGDPSSSIEASDITDTGPLQKASVFKVISSVYAMLAGKEDGEHFWKKSRHYRECFEQARQRAKVSIDTGSDGIADRTNIGSAIRLKRD